MKRTRPGGEPAVVPTKAEECGPVPGTYQLGK